MPDDSRHSPASLADDLKDLDPAEFGSHAKNVVLTWLESVGLPYEQDETEEGISWRLVVQVSEDWSVQVVHEAGSLDNIVIGTGTHLNDYHQRRIREDSPEGRRHLNRVLREALHSELIEKRFEVDTEEGEHPFAGIPQGFILRRRLFADGLTKNRFFEAMTGVHSVRMRGVTTIQLRYGTSDSPLDPVT